MPNSAAAFAGDAYGNVIPCLRVLAGASLEAALPTAAAVQIHNNTVNATQMVRIWAIGTDMYYGFGIAGMAAPTVADGMILSNTYQDMAVPSGLTHFRGIAAHSGSGSYRIELLT